MSQPADRVEYGDDRDDYHNAMQNLTKRVFSKALKLDGDNGRPKAEQRAEICELFETAVKAVPAAAKAAGRAPAPERQRLARQSPPTRADLLYNSLRASRLLRLRLVTSRGPPYPSRPPGPTRPAGLGRKG